VRIGEAAARVGATTDTIRFYERSGWLPRAARQDNRYRDYDEADVEHLRLLLELRRLDVPLHDAARIAGWCHSGHCAEASTDLPAVIGERRAELARRIDGLRALDVRLASLERHLRSTARSLAVIDARAGACCDAAAAVVGSGPEGCAWCATPIPG
jgi:DNA-binding transcriptional MerR regulator